MMKPRLLDLFSGAGGAAMGYSRAGFDVTGVDIRPQPHYPFAFILGDALEYVAAHGAEYDAIHASPTCQRYSEATPPERREGHPDYIPEVRKLLIATGKPYVIENVEGARALLRNPLMLCGTMFGMKLYRHRYFELSWGDALLSPMCCQHYPNPVLWTGMGGETSKGRRPRQSMEHKRTQGGIDWMTGAELTLAIPPAYTEYIGAQLLAYLSRTPAPAGAGVGGK